MKQQLQNIIPPRSGTAFYLRQHQQLVVTDLEGEQVADLICFSLEDTSEYLSSGRTIDYAGSIYLTTGHHFYSNRTELCSR